MILTSFKNKLGKQKKKCRKMVVYFMGYLLKQNKLEYNIMF